MINLRPYKGRGRSVLANVPISNLDEVKSLLRQVTPTIKYRIRYRGPRNTALDQGRGSNNRASTCLKVNAVKFSVYKDY